MAQKGKTLRRVWWWLGHILDDAAKKLGIWEVVLVPEGTSRSQNAHVELLPQVTILSMLPSQVPNSSIVESQHDGGPRFGEDLNGVSAHGVQKVIVLPLLRAPSAWLNGDCKE